MKKLGVLIRDARERLRLHGYELAKAIDKQPSYVTRLESGETKTLPPPEVLERIGAALHLSVRQMVEVAGYDLGPTDDPHAELHARLDAILAPVLDRPEVVDAILENARHTVLMVETISRQPPIDVPAPPQPAGESSQSSGAGR